MKQFLLIISFFAFSYSFSQEWQLIDEVSNGGGIYIRSHSSNSAWIKRTKVEVPLDYEKYGFDKTKEGYTLVLFKFDCSSLKLGMLATYYYNNEQEVEYSKQFKEYEVEMGYAVPDSRGEFWLKTFCKLE